LISREKATRHTPPGRDQNPTKERCIFYFMSAYRLTILVSLLGGRFLSYQNTLAKDSVEMAGFEPATFALQRRCSPTELHPQGLHRVSGLDRIRTCDPSLIRTVL
jgi:hypothetical protein